MGRMFMFWTWPQVIIRRGAKTCSKWWSGGALAPTSFSEESTLQKCGYLVPKLKMPSTMGGTWWNLILNCLAELFLLGGCVLYWHVLWQYIIYSYSMIHWPLSLFLHSCSFTGRKHMDVAAQCLLHWDGHFTTYAPRSICFATSCYQAALFLLAYKFLEDSGHTRSLGFRCHMCWRIQLPLLYFHQHAQDPESQTKLHKVDFAVCVYCVVGTQRSWMLCGA